MFNYQFYTQVAHIFIYSIRRRVPSKTSSLEAPPAAMDESSSSESVKFVLYTHVLSFHRDAFRKLFSKYGSGMSPETCRSVMRSPGTAPLMVAMVAPFGGGGGGGGGGGAGGGAGGFGWPGTLTHAVTPSWARDTVEKIRERE